MILIVGLVATIAGDTAAQGTYTFWFYDDTEPVEYMMYGTPPSGTTTSVTFNVVSFYSATFKAVDSIGAGTSTVYLKATNSGAASKTLTLQLVAGVEEVGTGGITIPKNTTTPTEFTASFVHSAHSFADGERLQLNIGKGVKVTIYWDGTHNTSRLVVEAVTAVILPSFTATPGDEQVVLEWETASEFENAGFNVWRSQVEDGPYTRLNQALIPARGGPTTGASYSYTDYAVINGITYYYKLEDVDIYGSSAMHGPVSATPSRTYRVFIPFICLMR